MMSLISYWRKTSVSGRILFGGIIAIIYAMYWLIAEPSPRKKPIHEDYTLINALLGIPGDYKITDMHSKSGRSPHLLYIIEADYSVIESSVAAGRFRSIMRGDKIALFQCELDFENKFGGTAHPYRPVEPADRMYEYSVSIPEEYPVRNPLSSKQMAIKSDLILDDTTSPTIHLYIKSSHLLLQRFSRHTWK